MPVWYGDVVIVAPNADTAYSGPGNCNIDLKGKIITVRSTDPADPSGRKHYGH